jgi:hypothetical protein
VASDAARSANACRSKSWPAALIDFVVIEERENVFSIRQSTGGFVSLQFTIVVVTPATLEHELIPEQHMLVAWTLSLGEAPGQNVVIGAARQNTIL